MLKKINFNNSTILFIGILFIFLGLFFGLYELFNQKKEKAFTEMNLSLLASEMPDSIENDNEIYEDIQTEPEISEEIPTKEEEKTEFKYDYIGYIEIPKINLKTGFVSIDSKYNNVDYNVTIIKGSTYPTEKNNNLILAAHSGNCSYCYFNKLFNLSIGDVAYINYNNSNYEYRLKNTYEVKKDGTVTLYRDYSKSVLTLITCTINTTDRQTVFIFEKVD